MFCTKCGHGLSENASFCGGCGAGRAVTGDVMTPQPPHVPIPVASSAPVQQVLPQLVFASQSPHRRDAPPEKSNSASTASWILLVFACAGAMVPGLGFGMWLIVGPILLITLVLGIVAITKGSTVNGVMIILASLIVVPLFVLLAPIVMTGAAFGAASASDSILEDANTAAVAESVVAAPADQIAWQDSQAEPSSNYDAPAQSSPAPVYHSSSVEPTEIEVAPSYAATYGNNDEFVYRANLVDPRGVVVLQSAPSITAKNVDKLQSGTPIVAAGTEGKWIKVRTASGLIGYVRQKQLEFQPNQ